jgi:hypothetical protein
MTRICYHCLTTVGSEAHVEICTDCGRGDRIVEMNGSVEDDVLDVARQVTFQQYRAGELPISRTCPVPGPLSGPNHVVLPFPGRSVSREVAVVRPVATVAAIAVAFTFSAVLGSALVSLAWTFFA